MFAWVSGSRDGYLARSKSISFCVRSESCKGSLVRCSNSSPRLEIDEIEDVSRSSTFPPGDCRARSPSKLIRGSKVGDSVKLLLLLEEDDSEGGIGIDAGSWIRLNRPPWIGGTKLTQGPATRPIRYRDIDCRVSLECSLQQLSTFLTRAVESFLFQN